VCAAGIVWRIGRGVIAPGGAFTAFAARFQSTPCIGILGTSGTPPESGGTINARARIAAPTARQKVSSGEQKSTLGIPMFRVRETFQEREFD
jgi:hypothetical protein